jgi:predicted small lipoprotein YifL
MQVSDRIRPAFAATAVLTIVLSGALAGCGQKGSLYRDAGNAAGQATETASQSQSASEPH